MIIFTVHVAIKGVDNTLVCCKYAADNNSNQMLILIYLSMSRVVVWLVAIGAAGAQCCALLVLPFGGVVGMLSFCISLVFFALFFY